MTYAFTAVAVVSAASAVYSGVQQNKAAKAQASASRESGAAAQNEAAMEEAFNKQEAADITTQSESEADMIKQQAMIARAQAMNAQAGSGVVIGEGSAQAALEQIDMLSSADALAVLYSGVNQSTAMRASGRMTAQAGREKNRAYGQASASQLQAGKAALVGGMLQAGANIAGAYYKLSSPGTTGGKV